MQENSDKGSEFRIIHVDFVAAFDLVNCLPVLFKLQNLRFGGFVLVLLQDFLTGRQQHVVVNGIFSGPRSVSSGVLQGSVLSSLIFQYTPVIWYLVWKTRFSSFQMMHQLLVL